NSRISCRRAPWRQPDVVTNPRRADARALALFSGERRAHSLRWGGAFGNPMPARAAGMTVERIGQCDARTFHHHVQMGTPLVITGLVPTWPALHKWTPEYLADVCGDRPITVSDYADGKTLSG